MNESTNAPAVIYRRVASKNGPDSEKKLLTQEERCRRYAEGKGYSVAHVFTDDGIFGACADRPEVSEMLKFLRSKSGGQTHVIIDDVSRLARDTETHLVLRRLIADAGGILEAATADETEAVHD